MSTFVGKHLERLESRFTIPKATFIIAVLTLVSRLSGLIRTRLFTSRFGAGQTLDIYYASFRIPDFITNVLILSTLTVALLPVFTKTLLQNKQKAYELAHSILTIAFLVMVVVCVVVMLFLGPLTRTFLPGFSGESLAATIQLTRIILVAQVIFSISNLFTTLLNAQKRFIVAATAPVLYNVGIIGGLLFVYPHVGLIGLGYGVVLGACLHLLLQAIELARLGFFWKPIIAWNNSGIKQVLALFIPRLFYLDLSQVSLLVASFLGSLLSSGSISVFSLAFDLQAVPTGIFALSAAVAVFPVLSESYAAQDTERFWRTLATTITQTLFFIIPISVVMLVLRAHIVRLLFGTGKFDWNDTIATFQVLGVFTFSLFSQSLIPILSRALYARHNTKTPMLIGFVAVCINIVCAYVLAHTVIRGASLGIVGVAYGFSIASIANLVLLYGIIRTLLAKDAQHQSHIIKAFDAVVTIGFTKIITASIALGVVTYVSLHIFAHVVDTHTGIGLLIQAGAASVLGGFAFLAAAQFLAIREVQPVLGILRSIRKFL